MKPTFFASPQAFRQWLERRHDSARELLVGFHKKDSGRPSITWPESVDEALCYGWIDGVRRRIDEESYSIRFTPRRQKSLWSAKNIARVAELEAEGRMRPSGLAAFSRRIEAKSEIYSYEQARELRLDAEHEQLFRANNKAWQFFKRQPAGYRSKSIWWVRSAKRDSTRLNRLRKLIERSALGERAW